MDLKESLLLELEKRTREHELKENDLFTASSLASFFKMGRNTISQYLNDYVKNEKVIKVNTRPVYFFHKQALEEKYETNFNDCIYDSIASLKILMMKDFEKMIGYNGSLKSVITHCKAAMSYPDNGLPILICGPTGTGKSMIASLMYEYASHQGILKKDAKFISVNCSEYADNPELLVDNLFGHVKGAYTGADEDQVGLIQLANGGVLFLDEVHCLKAECQEKLFLFMDKGIFHRLGDNEKWYQSNCRLIFATTENPDQVLVHTLLRRIPIVVHIPSLSERPQIEKMELIYTMLMKESLNLNKSLCISNYAYKTILSYDYKGNIGQLQNVIKASCARTFLHENKDNYCIRLLDLPDYMFESMDTNILKNFDQNEKIVSVLDLNKEIKSDSPLMDLYDNLLNTFKLLEKEEETLEQIIERCKLLIQNFFDWLFFKKKNSFKSSNENYLLKMLDKICSIIMNKYSFTMPNTQIKIYSKVFVEYTKIVTDAQMWYSFHEEEVQRILSLLQEQYPRDYLIANELLENACLNLDIKMDKFMDVIMTIEMIKTQKEEKENVMGLILCHGYSTASSIADTVNQLLGEHIFDGIDMELKISIDRIAQLVDDYLQHKEPIQELMILVDMGSLEGIYKRIRLPKCNIGIIDMVSTPVALEVGNHIQQGHLVKDILEEIKNNFNISTRLIEEAKKQDAILTICATGIGVAKKISVLLTNSLPKPIPAKIIPYDYHSIVENGVNDSIYSQYNVLMLVGTLDPKVEGTPFLPLENLIDNDQIQVLVDYVGQYFNEEELSKFRQNVMKNFALSNIVNHLTILNAQKVIDDVEEFVLEAQRLLDKNMDSTSRLGLYVHVACLIERLMLKQGIDEVEGMETYSLENKEQMDLIRQAFSGVQEHYSVELPDPEIMYILNYFQE
ncbi:MAG: sigma 54-interacting transcriptional regulator [Erysipelotrichaceae bacterium]|uniref:sigma 54-interacting transcriptional regulator n=1 Tax=Floccifex sp. TaxID=2815810 RepID=UPI002A752DF4|nr:sigma 54-interacting transcriptional regulator [Floccifex sp.]MDD7281202.1 sigma 54-interacting transcriptional regulator [Erysipelotrichaceae bacterium]MDY2958260.1 sigma 54-interacting transcriptional regulator [Floccifex sp.]